MANLSLSLDGFVKNAKKGKSAMKQTVLPKTDEQEHVPKVKVGEATDRNVV